MIEKFSALRPVRKVSAFVVGVWDTFLRDNKVIPPVLAVAALFVFAWIVFGSFIGTPEDEPVASQDEIAQSEGGENAQPAPEIENPNTDSYAAYQSKDPFRQLFQSAESTTQETTTPDDTGGSTDDSSGDGAPGGGGSNLGGSDDGTSTGNPGAGNSGAADDQYENGRTPREDFTEDPDDTGADDTDTGTQTPQPQNPNRPAAGSDGDLFDSGGELEAPNRR
jgi:hypothetical protein